MNNKEINDRFNRLEDKVDKLAIGYYVGFGIVITLQFILNLIPKFL